MQPDITCHASDFLQLQMAELARRKVIDVDDFAKEDLELQEGRIR